MQHQKVSGQGIDLSEGEEAGLPSQTTEARRDKRRGRLRAKQGSWEGGGGPGEGGESGRQRQESAESRARDRRDRRLELQKAPAKREATTGRDLEGDKEEKEPGSEGNGEKN